MRRILIAAAGVTTVAAGILFDAGIVSAHDPGFSLDCDGATLTGVGYEAAQTNEASIAIDGTEVFHVDDFGTDFSETVAIPQDGLVHTVHFVIDAQGEGTEDHPEYDLDVTEEVGPCGEVTTTTASSTTTTTTEPTTTTTEPATTTTTSTTTSTTSTTSTSTTSTVPSTSTTSTSTTLPSTLSVAAFSPVCLRDAPYVDVTFGDQPEFNGHTATVTFVDLDGNVVATHTATYQAGATVRFIYPGAEVDASGNPVDWPGWVFDGDEWVIDPSDSRLRDGLTVVVEVNPTASGSVGYPPATPECDASPPGSPPDTGLPETGAYSTSVLLLASVLLIGGVALVAVTRLRVAKK